MMMKFDGAMLFVADLPAMAAFYRDVVGLNPIEATMLPHWVEFETGEARFSLHAIPAEMGARPSASPREMESCKLLLSVGDLALARAKLASGGATILERAWGGWDFADPEGNVWGVRLEPGAGR